MFFWKVWVGHPRKENAGTGMTTSYREMLIPIEFAGSTVPEKELVK